MKRILVAILAATLTVTFSGVISADLLQEVAPAQVMKQMPEQKMDEMKQMPEQKMDEMKQKQMPKRPY